MEEEQDDDDDDDDDADAARERFVCLFDNIYAVVD